MEKLKDRIDQLQDKLLKEDQILQTPRQDGVRKLIHEFLESEEIRDAKIDGFFLKNAINANDPNGLDVWAKKREFFSDLRELLQGSKYSGAQSKMEEILQYSNFIVSDVKAVRPANIDTRLLDDDRSQQYGESMVGDLKRHSRVV